jgi:hypothetical protein
MAWAVLEMNEVTELGERLGLEEIQNRVELLVDETPLDVEISPSYSSRPTQVLVTGATPLDLGWHRAVVKVHRTSGQILEYEWEFNVVAEEPTLPGLPDEFYYVRPLPDSTITLQDYREQWLVPLYYYDGTASLPGGVCVGVVPEEIVEPGEYLDEGGVTRKYSFVALDGVPPGADAKIEAVLEPYRVSLTDERGREVGSYVGVHNSKCWYVDLAPGRHEATIQIRKASGERIEFTWWFVISHE